MEDRSWHSDPTLLYEEDFNDSLSEVPPSETNLLDWDDKADKENLDVSVLEPLHPSTVGHHTRLGNARASVFSSPSAKERSSSHGSQSARRDTVFCARKKGLYSTKELDEMISGLQKENMRLRIRVQVLERRLNDEDGDESITKCVDYEIRMNELLTELNLKKEECEKNRVLLVDRGSDVPFSAETSVQMNHPLLSGSKYPPDMDTTEYQDFPVHLGRMGASSAMSPFRKTMLVGDNTIRHSGVVSPQLNCSRQLSGSSVRVSKSDRQLFQMLIGHLKDVVAFLGRGMNGSFDVSDVSLNIPQASIIDTVEVSFISEIGQGDGSHASFSLAAKLQEMIDLSREISFHDVEVETDEQWEKLRDENLLLQEQLVAIKSALQVTQANCEDIQLYNAKVLEQMATSETSYKQQLNDFVVEINRLTNELQQSHDSKSRLEKELTGFMDQITSLEQHMMEHKANQQFIVDHTAPRPDCDASTETEETIASLDSRYQNLLITATDQERQVKFLESQLKSMEDVKVRLQNRIEELGGLMDQLESSETEKHSLENRIEELSQAEEKMEQELKWVKDVCDGLQKERDEMEYDKRRVTLEFAEFKSQSGQQMDKTNQDLARLESIFSQREKERESLEADLRVVTGEIDRLESQLQSRDSILIQQKEHNLQLQLLLNKPRQSMSQQTDLCWSTFKSEKVEMISTITKLMDEAETLERALIDTKRGHEQLIDRKNRDIEKFAAKIDAFATESEQLLQLKSDMEDEIHSLRHMYSESEEKLRASEKQLASLTAEMEIVRPKAGKLEKWEKAVHKQIGKTQKVITMANQNMAAGLARQSRPTAAAPSESGTTRHTSSSSTDPR